jgi:hypothetical protein
VVAQHQLPGGALVSDADLVVRKVVAADAPHGFLSETTAAVGRTVAAPVAEGQILTDLALVSTRAVVGAGHVVAPLRLADAGLVRLLRPGDVVDVVGADDRSSEARVVAAGARVVTVPAAQDTTSAESSGALVLVEVSAGAATALAQAGVGGSLTVTWR